MVFLPLFICICSIFAASILLIMEPMHHLLKAYFCLLSILLYLCFSPIIMLMLTFLQILALCLREELPSSNFTFHHVLVCLLIAALLHGEIIFSSLNPGVYPYSFYRVYIYFPTLPLSSVLIADVNAGIFILAITGCLQKIVSGCQNFL